MNKPQDQVICIRQGEYESMVDGKLYGTWDSKEVAQVGLLVEQRRAAARKARIACPIELLNAKQDQIGTTLQAPLPGKTVRTHR